jgi:glycosyltransferase involved in cell wall biosynthesis
MISFVVPAHNEAALIRATCESIVGAARVCGTAFELIVVDDGSSDGTAEVASAAGASVVRIERLHIAAARNAGARHARGESLVFVDADTLINAAVLSGVIAALAAGACGGGSRVQFDEPVPAWARVMLAATVWTFGRLRYAAGCFIFCTRQAFEATGGFDEQVFAGEEIYFSRALKRHGRLEILKASVISSGRKFRTHSTWELHRDLLRLAVRGTRGLRSKRHLAIWYGPRRGETK